MGWVWDGYGTGMGRVWDGYETGMGRDGELDNTYNNMQKNMIVVDCFLINAELLKNC